MHNDTFFSKSVIPPPKDASEKYREIIYHVDSRHRDREAFPNASKFNVDLDEHQIRDVKKISLVGYDIPTNNSMRLDRTNNLLHIATDTNQERILELTPSTAALTPVLLRDALNSATEGAQLPLRFDLVGDRRMVVVNTSATKTFTLLLAAPRNGPAATYIPRSVGKLLGWNATNATIAPTDTYAPDTDMVLEPYEYCVLFMNGIKRVLSPFAPHTHAFAMLPFSTDSHGSRNLTDLPFEKNLPAVLSTVKRLSVKLLTPYGDALDIPPDRNVQLQLVFKCMKQPSSYHVL